MIIIIINNRIQENSRQPANWGVFCSLDSRPGYTLTCAIGRAVIYLTKACVRLTTSRRSGASTEGGELSGRAHKGSTQSAAAARPGENVTTQLIQPARHRSASHSHRAQILFITVPPLGPHPPWKASGTLGTGGGGGRSR